MGQLRGFRPLGCKVLVAMDAEQTMASELILLHPEYYRFPVLATVLEAGPGNCSFVHCPGKQELRPGDRVYVGKFNGTEVNLPECDLQLRLMRTCRQDLVTHQKMDPEIARRAGDIYCVVHLDSNREQGIENLHKWLRYIKVTL